MNTKRLLSIILCAAVLLSLSACGSGDFAKGEVYFENEAYSQSVAGATDGVSPAGSSVTDSRLIIYNADVNVETTDFDAAAKALNELVSDFSARISNSQVRGSADYSPSGSATVTNRNAWYEIEVPADRLDDFLSRSGDLGNVTGQSKTGSDITEAYSDNEARLSALRTEQQRLTALIDSADTVNDLIALEDRLSSISAEIESLESSKRRWDKQLAYSNVTVTINEVTLYSGTGSRSIAQRIGNAFTGGFASFGRGLVSFAVGVIYLLPYIIIAAVAVSVFIAVRKKKRKHAKAKSNNTEA